MISNRPAAQARQGVATHSNAQPKLSVRPARVVERIHDAALKLGARYRYLMGLCSEEDRSAAALCNGWALRRNFAADLPRVAQLLRNFQR